MNVAYSRAEVEELLHMVARDANPAQIAEKLGRSVYSVRVKAHQLGVRWRRAGGNFLVLRDLDETAVSAFYQQAFARSMAVEDYVGMLLRIIAQDNLFSAILDDQVEKRLAP